MDQNLVYTSTIFFIFKGTVENPLERATHLLYIYNSTSPQRLELVKLELSVRVRAHIQSYTLLRSRLPED